MIDVAALTSGRAVPSARLRIRQYIEPLGQLGIEVSEYLPAINKYGPLPGWPRHLNPYWGLPLNAIWQGVKLASRIPGVVGSWRHHISWLERELLSGMLTLEPVIRRPMVMDVDDAIWLSPPLGRFTAATIARRADVVIVGNAFLAEWFGRHAHDVRVIPTAVNTDRFWPLGASSERSRFAIGWIGSGSNLRYLEQIEAPLARFLGTYRDSELTVISDRAPRLRYVPADRVRFVRWAERTEVSALQQLDVGLMPLSNSDWTRGKCSLKMLQYMACAVAVVVSPIGMNAEVLRLGEAGFAAVTSGEWYESLVRLYMNPQQRLRFGANGRSIVLKHFERRLVAGQLADVFRELS